MLNRESLYELIFNSTGLQVTSVAPQFMTGADLSAAVTSLHNSIYYGKVVVSSKPTGTLSGSYLVFSLQGKVVFVVDFTKVGTLPLDAQNWPDIAFDECYLSDDPSGYLATPAVVAALSMFDTSLSRKLFAVAPTGSAFGTIGLYVGTADALHELDVASGSASTITVGAAAAEVKNSARPYFWINYDHSVNKPGAWFLISPLANYGFPAVEEGSGPDNTFYEGFAPASDATIEYLGYPELIKNISCPVGMSISEITLMKYNYNLPIAKMQGGSGFSLCTGQRYRVKTNKVGGTVTLRFKTSTVFVSEMDLTCAVNAAGYFEFIMPLGSAGSIDDTDPSSVRSMNVTAYVEDDASPVYYTKQIQNTSVTAYNLLINGTPVAVPAGGTVSFSGFAEPTTLVNNTNGTTGDMQLMNGSVPGISFAIPKPGANSKVLSGVNGFTKIVITH